MSASGKSDHPWAGLYATARWQRLRAYQLRNHPLCKFCLDVGKVTPAEIADHVEPHHGDRTKFFTGALQSLCKSCHDSAKRQIELNGFRRDVGLDGWPLDRNHPIYRKDMMKR
jgi:5-methylcytosine-specific restriction enzyme A